MVCSFARRWIMVGLGLALAVSAHAQTVVSGTYTGATIAGDIVIANSTGATFTSGTTGTPTTFTGTNATWGTNAYLYWQQVGTLASKTLTFGSGSLLYVTGVNNTLTLDAGTTATGDIQIRSDGNTGTAITNQGSITHTNTGSGQVYARNFSNTGTITANAGSLLIGSTSSGYNTNNSGTIVADGSSTTVYLDGNVANTGTVRAQNSGTIYLRGNNTTANLGTVQLTTGGHARLNGTLDNTAATLNAPSGGAFELYYGTILGGTIANNALTFTNGYGTFDGVTYSGDLILPASTGVYFTNGTTFTGSSLNLGSNAAIYWQQTGSLTGKTLTMGSNSLLYVTGANHTLTLSNTTAATGDIQIRTDGNTGTAIINQGTITHNTTGSGQLYGRTVTNSGTITASSGSLVIGSTSTGYDTGNSGTIVADGSSTALYLDGNVTNTGTVRAQNSGTIYLRGNNTTANLGTVQITTGGHVRLYGTLDNTAATLNAPSGGQYELYYGTVKGGTIASNALTFTNAYGTLDGATYTGDLSLPASTGSYFTGGASFTGTDLTFGSNAAIYWQQAGTLVGKTLTFGSNSLLYITGLNNALTLDGATTATGDIQIRTDGNTGTAITNQGSITHNTTGSGQIYGRSVTNAGTITATAGSLQIGTSSTGYNTSNSGTINASGSGTNLYLDGNVANTGTLSAQNSGSIYFRGTNTTANLGTVEIATGGRIFLNGTLTNTAATLNAPTGGQFELYYGTIAGGTIANGAITFTGYYGTLDGATYNGNLTFPASAGAYFTNGANFTGSALTFGTNSALYWQQVGTLASKTLTFGSNSLLYVTGTNNTLTLDGATTASGDLQIRTDGSNGTAITNQGTLTHNTTGSGQIYGRNVTNAGTITATAGSLQIGTSSTSYNTSNTGTIVADGSSTTVYLDGNVANTGTIRAQNAASISFRGTNTSANLGTVQLATGGRALLNGTLTNTSATLNAPSGGQYELYYGTIVGGTIASGALTFSSYYGTLDGATYSGNLAFPANTGAYFTNGANFTGATLTLGDNSALYWQQVGTLAGKALNFGSNSLLYVTGANNTLTLDGATTATGDIRIQTDGNSGTAITNQGSVTHNTTGSGQLYARTLLNTGTISATAGALTVGTTSSGYSTSNTGTIIADGSGTDLYLQGTVANTGTIRAQNSGSIYFQGTNTTANLGTVQIATGGHARFYGTLTNTGATLNPPSGGSYELYYGTIVGGTIAPNALTLTGAMGTLDGVTYSGDFVLPAGAGVFWTGNSGFNGSALTLGNSSFIYWQQASTLANKALTFGISASIYITGTNNALTLAPSSSASGDVQIYTDGSNGTAFTNQGTITHTTGSGNIYARAFTNSGNITATGGSLSLGLNSTSYATSNSGTITSDGSSTHVYLNGSIANTGTIQVKNSGSLHTNALTNSTGGVIGGSGTIFGNVSFAGGTLAPGNSIGTLTFQSGTMSVTSPTVFAVELGGTSSDQLVFQNPPSVVNLGTGLLTLSLTLLAAPTDNTSYNVIRISSGGTGITGTFANLPTSGSTISALFGGNSYTFGVNYSTNLVSLNFNAVPEPSTYALVGAGLLLLGCRHVRRRRGAK